MPISGTTSSEDKQLDTGVNANANSTTTPLSLGDAKYVGLFVKGKTGTHTTHVVTLQLYDGVNWWDLNHTITGEGQLHEEICIGEEIRAKVTTAQGATSTVDITIIIK